MVHIHYVDEVEGEQPEEEATDPAGQLEELQGHGVVFLVLHLHLGPGPVDDGVEGEVAGVGPVATDDEEGAENSKNNADENVEKVEQRVDGEEAAAIANLVVLLLRKVFSRNLLSASAGLVLNHVNFGSFFLGGNSCLGHGIIISFGRGFLSLGGDDLAGGELVLVAADGLDLGVVVAFG